MTLKTTIGTSFKWLTTPALWPAINEPTRIMHAASEVELLAAGATPRVPTSIDIQEVKARLVRALMNQSLDSIRQRDWKRAPWAFWFDGDDVARNLQIRSEFFRRAENRKSASWIKSLINSYLINFPSQSDSLNPIAERLAQLVMSGNWPNLNPWMSRHQKCQIFSPSIAPKNIAGNVLGASSLSRGKDEVGLADPIYQTSQSGLLAAAYPPAIDHVRSKLSGAHADSENLVRRLIEWSIPLNASESDIRYPAFRNPLIESLLLPWKGRKADPGMEQLIKSFILDRIGDPRLSPGAWQTINPSAKEVMLRWLAGDTLEQFFDILSKTADEIWEYRKRFWMAYYRKGAITEAWFALGYDAWAMGNRWKQKIPGLDFGELYQAQGSQSVLLMKLDNLVIAEWSHSGKCRIWNYGDSIAPVLYKKSYDAPDLRNVSLHDQIHYGSPNGTWQRQIADFIRKRTGISIGQNDWQ